LGDIAILKSDLFGAKVSATVASKLQPVVGYYPVIDLKLIKPIPSRLLWARICQSHASKSTKTIKHQS
jgi:hypothetical protein